MTKINIRIQIVRTLDPDLSSLKLVSAEAIQAILGQYYQTVVITTVRNVDDLVKLAATKPDLVFSGFKYLMLGSKKIWLSTFLDDRGINHTGSTRAAIEFEQDKSLAKQRVLHHGLSTPAYLVAPGSQQLSPAAMTLRLPVFVKPMNQGGSRGINELSVTRSLAEVNAKLAELQAHYSTDALIEEYLPGREFGVAILKREHTRGYWVMPVELKPPANAKGDRLLSYARKTSSLPTPAFIVKDIPLRTEISNLALAVFKALGARDYARIDVRLDAYGRPSFIEANLLPGLMCDSGYFFRACKLHLRMDLEGMILAIVRLALQRAPAPTKQSSYPKALEFDKITQYLPS